MARKFGEEAQEMGNLVDCVRQLQAPPCVSIAAVGSFVWDCREGGGYFHSPFCTCVVHAFATLRTLTPAGTAALSGCHVGGLFYFCTFHLSNSDFISCSPSCPPTYLPDVVGKQPHFSFHSFSAPPLLCSALVPLCCCSSPLTRSEELTSCATLCD